LDKINFQNSAWSILNKARKLHDQKDLVPFYQFIAQNSDLLSYENGAIVYKTYKTVLPVVNKSGILYIGKVLYLFSKDGQYIVDSGSMSDLQEVMSSKKSIEGKYTFFPKKSNSNGGSIDRSCGYDLPLIETNNGTSNNRLSQLVHWQESFLIQTVFSPSPSRFTVENTFHVVGFSFKKNLVGNFVAYNTNHNLEYNFTTTVASLSNLVTGPSNTPTGAVVSKNITNHSGTKSNMNEHYIEYFTNCFRATNVPFYCLTYCNPIWNVITLDRHNHQGMNGFWSTYNCY
jgi:hypothetical protein